jgi:hypothetical protein
MPPRLGLARFRYVLQKTCCILQLLHMCDCHLAHSICTLLHVLGSAAACPSPFYRTLLTPGHPDAGVCCSIHVRPRAHRSPRPLRVSPSGHPSPGHPASRSGPLCFRHAHAVWGLPVPFPIHKFPAPLQTSLASGRGVGARRMPSRRPEEKTPRRDSRKAMREMQHLIYF